MPKNYWMLVTNLENFHITRDLGFNVQGLKGQHKKKVQRLEPGDRILYYVTGKRCFAAIATVASKYFEDSKPVWKKEGTSGWPYRVRIQPDLVLDDEQFMDAHQIAPRMDHVRTWSPEDWYMAFLVNFLHIIPKKDLQLIENEMRKLRPRRIRRPDQAKPGGRRDGARQVGRPSRSPTPADTGA